MGTPPGLPLTRQDLIEILRDELRRSFSALFRESRSRPDKVVLSFREAARVLGISRNTTLVAAVRAGAIRTVIIAGHRKIPRSEIERVQLDGLRIDTRPSRRRHQRRRKSDPAAEILSLDY